MKRQFYASLRTLTDPIIRDALEMCGIVPAPPQPRRWLFERLDGITIELPDEVYHVKNQNP